MPVRTALDNKIPPLYFKQGAFIYRYGKLYVMPLFNIKIPVHTVVVLPNPSGEIRKSEIEGICRFGKVKRNSPLIKTSGAVNIVHKLVADVIPSVDTVMRPDIAQTPVSVKYGNVFRAVRGVVINTVIH